MEGRGMKEYRQKMVAAKKQHNWEMNQLEKERKIAWKSDRLEQNHLVSRLESIQTRIHDINKCTSARRVRRLKLQTASKVFGSDATFPRGYPHNEDKTPPYKSDENGKSAVISRGTCLSSSLSERTGKSNVFQNVSCSGQKQGGVARRTTWKCTGTFLLGNLSEETPLQPRVTEKSTRFEQIWKDVCDESALGDFQFSPPRNVRHTKNGDRKLPKETADEDTKNSAKPRLVRRQSMDPTLLASLLDVDQSSIPDQKQIFEMARLVSDAALRATAEVASLEKPKENGRKRPPFRLQRRASVASMHSAPGDLMSSGPRQFPSIGPSAKDSPASPRLRMRRGSLPSLTSTNLAKLSQLGPGTSTRTRSIESTMKCSSLDKLENVIE